MVFLYCKKIIDFDIMASKILNVFYSMLDALLIRDEVMNLKLRLRHSFIAIVLTIYQSNSVENFHTATETVSCSRDNLMIYSNLITKCIILPMMEGSSDLREITILLPSSFNYHESINIFIKFFIFFDQK